MKPILTFLILACFVLIAACNSEESGDALPRKVKTKTEKAEIKYDGKKIYQKYCVACHGAFGNSEINGAKDLTVSHMDKKERIEIVKNGKGLMTPFKGTLKPGQIEAVVQYTFDLMQ